MNPSAPSADRIQWTTEALNQCLGIQQSVQELKIDHTAGHTKLAGGTTSDSVLLYNRILVHVGTSRASTQRSTKYRSSL